MNGIIWQTSWWLGLVLLLAAALIYWTPRRRGGRQPSTLRLRDSLALGPRERIALIEVAGQWLVLGITAGQIQTLLTIAAPDDEPANNTIVPTTTPRPGERDGWQHQQAEP